MDPIQSNLIIGEDPVDVDELVGLIENSPSYPQLLKDWEFFVDFLEVPHTKNLILEGRGDGRGLLHEVYSVWRTDKGRGARLSVLYDALLNCMLDDIAASLEAKYWLVAVKLLKIKLPGGKEATVEEATKLTSVEKYRKICNEIGFRDVIWGQPIELSGIIDATPEDFYIPRKLSRTTQIDRKIFTRASHDLFLVKGIRKNKLEKVSGHLAVDDSGNQLKNVTVRIMMLENDDHFQRICKITKNPVHLIEHKNGSFYWNNSHGSLDTIQRFIRESKNYFSEDDLMETIPHSTRATIISGSPGMGKTFLLHNLAKKMSAKKKSIVLFIPMKDLSLGFGIDYSLRSAISTITKYYTRANKVWGLVLKEILKNSAYHFDFFFDGYDEVNVNEFGFADSFLDELKKFKHFRIHVSTRPHLRPRLERVLNVISYEIMPFDESNQEEFLSCYWINDLGLGVEHKEKLRSYTGKWLEMLNQHTGGSEHAMSGIPHHCLAFAKAFKDDAHKAITLNLEKSHYTTDATALFDTYKSLVDSKFGNFSPDTTTIIYWLKQLARTNYVNAHVYESIALLFPGWVEVFKPHLEGYREIEELELFRIGLIEKIPYKNSRKFIHKSFAQYLLAEYLVKNLSSGSLFVRMIYGVILQSEDNENESDLLQKWHPSKTRMIKYPVLSYFVNMHLRYQTTICSMDDLLVGIAKHPSEIQFKQLCEAMGMCIIQDLEFCLKLAIKLVQLTGINVPFPTEIFSQLPSSNYHPTTSQSSENKVLINTFKLIGKGSNSEVYEGTYEGRLVAIKQIKVHRRESEKLNQLKQETNVLIKCDDHDNVVQYFFQSHNESNGLIEYRLVMELCESTLKEFVENKASCFQRLDISDEPPSIELLRQMTEGLFHLHNRKERIIHRDLKPENILLKARHGQIIVKLADFGISKVISDGKTHHTSKDFAGTIDWIAPELLHALLNKEAFVRLTIKVDIFSLGCLFWYVLSNGKHPFVRAPSSETEYQPKLEINTLENQALHCTCLRLILFMISFHENERPSIEDIKNHPIFWPAERKVLFITESIDLGSKQGQTQVENWLKINYQKLAGRSHSNFDRIFSKVEGQENGWLGCLTENIEKALQNKKSKNQTKYNGKSFIDLLTAIRNLKAHLREKDDSVKEELGGSPDDFITYWHSPGRFPFLLDCLWTWTEFQSKEDSGLKKYYKGVRFNFAKIMKNENQFVV